MKWDHLDGRVFVDRLRGIRRELIFASCQKDEAHGEVVRVVFFGTPAFAVPTLERLLASIHPIVGVVTQPDRPRGRGHRVTESPVKEIATTHSIPTLQPLRMKDPDFVDALAALEPDLAVVAAYGKILPDRLLALHRLGVIKRACLAPATLPRCRPDSSGRHRRGNRNRGHDHPTCKKNGRGTDAPEGHRPDRRR